MSPAWLAPAPVIAAAHEVVLVMAPGARPPKASWVTLPMPPIGLMSVSPTDRTATIARMLESATAMIVM
jgi:hypothetical protein